MYVDPLDDKVFLRNLDKYKNKIVYAKIVTLTLDLQPIMEIQGVVSTGSINVDGQSIVRRTCNLTLVSDQSYNHAYIHWSLRTRFKLYIGVENEIEPAYPHIIWFPMGHYVITQFNMTLNEQGAQIQIQGRDKMCMLNGDLSGALVAETDFGYRWEQIKDTNRYDKKEIPIKTIIREAVHEYAQEPYGNIIIDDLDTCGVELLEYRAKDNPIYVYEIQSGTSLIQNMCFENSPLGQILANGSDVNTGIPIYTKSRQLVGWSYDDNGKQTNLQYKDVPVYQGDGLTVQHDGYNYHIVKRADYGETIGYRATDLTYAGDLIAKVGESITSIFDKIVKMLGDFEYFYDIDGRFRFRKKHSYYSTSWSNAVVSTESTPYQQADVYYDSTVATSANTYNFEDGILINSYQNKPNLTVIKNDYSVWGELKGVNKKTYPIHLRVAIDIKPHYYASVYYPLYPQEFTEIFGYDQNSAIWVEAQDQQGGQVRNIIWSSDVYDWREVLYHMAWESLQLRGKIEDLSHDILLHGDPDFKKAAWLSKLEAAYKVTLNTGYSMYYTDILGFWTDLYRTSRTPYIKYEYDEWGNKKTMVDAQGNQFFVEDQINSFSMEKWKEWQANGYWNPEYFRWERSTLTKINEFNEEVLVHPAGTVTIYNPDKLHFWLDFLDPNSDLRNYSVPAIGRRAKVVNDKNVRSLFVKDTPPVLFIDPNAEIIAYEKNLHYVRLNVPASYGNYFVMSAQGKSAKEAMDSLIYEGTYYQDAITISAIPVYYLEPNTRIKIYDEHTGINGDYLIKSLSYSLSYNGMMTIQGTKAEERIL